MVDIYDCKRYLRNLWYFLQHRVAPVLHHALWMFTLGIYVYVAYIFSYTGNFSNNGAWETYGFFGAFILHFVKLPVYLALPWYVFSLLGFLLFNPFNNKASLRNVTGITNKFVCFRVVTKGLFPNLVKKTVEQNIKTCIQCGVQTFKFEIVTDKKIDINGYSELRQVVVPDEYKTRKGALFKARALQYCLEPGVCIYSDEDWIVHLDEETILTKESLFGIFEFITCDKFDIGQGAITYANGEIVNWFTTLADAVRLVCDYGGLRFCLGFCHGPVLNCFKGSYIVTKNSTEKTVGFDVEPCCSITEDLYFALKAWKMGYTFNYIKGEMFERSPFTLLDFLQQRQRWFLGSTYILWKSDIAKIYKIALLTNHLSCLLLWCSILNGPLSFYFPIYVPPFFSFSLCLVYGMTPFNYLIGNYIQMRLRYPGEILRPLAWAVASQPLVWFCGLVESCAFTVLFQRSELSFHIVNKEE